jgi:hypothetical protein
MVEYLVGVGRRFSVVHAASDKEHGNAVLHRIRDNVDGVGYAGAERCDENAGCAVAVEHTLSHETAGVFVLDERELDTRFVDALHHGKYLTAGNAKRVATAGFVEFATDDL